MSRKINYCQTYSFHTYEQDGTLGIRIFGINEKNESVYILVDDFKKYIYIELPSQTVQEKSIIWSSPCVTSLCTKLDSLCKDYKIIKKEIKSLKKLYFAKMDVSPEGMYSEKKYPFLKLYFNCEKDLDDFRWKVYREIYVSNVGNIKLQIHEIEASSVLQFMCMQNIKPSSWIQFPGKEIPEDQRESYADHEYIVSYSSITPYESTKFARPLILSFDIEVNSVNPNKMPNVGVPGDKVFQISAVFCRNGDNESKYEKILLTLCRNKNGEIVKTDQKICGDDVEIRHFETEGDLLNGFTELVCEKNPQVICGYNIFSFDIPYMYDRSRLTYTTSGFDKIGFIRSQHAKLTPITWSSKAFGKQDYKYLDAHGRLWVDLLPIVTRDYKLEDYKLKTVSEFFLNGLSKDDLPPKGIFKCYRDFTSESLGQVGHYCVMDSFIVLKLFEKLQMWIGLVEMSNVCNTPIFTLFTQGQQIKMFHQVYKKCINDIVIDKSSFQLAGVAEDDKYTGAYVFPPTPGLYDMVVSADFCLTGDTLVSLSNGMSRRIKDISRDDKLWVKDTSSNKNGLIQDNPVGLKCNGIKKILKITMIDGRTIRCTPDHKFLTDSGEWVKACDLTSSITYEEKKMVKKSGTKLVLGLEQPEDFIGNDEKEWSIFDYNMSNKIERDKTLAFSRILGFVLADGWIGVRQIEACFGTRLDAKLFCDDVKLLTGKDSPIRNRERDTEKGSTYTINLLSEIAKKIISLEGIVIGKRSTQKPSLPKFILDKNCPVSVVREFLGGLFGGDGCAPYLSAGNEKIKSRFGFVSLKWDIIEKFNKDMEIVMDQLCLLTKKVGLEFYRLNKGKVSYSNSNMRPKDSEENPRYSHMICLTHDDNLKFCEKIGFRYCIYKSCKLSIAASYQRLADNVRRQHDIVYNNTMKNGNVFNNNNLIESKNDFFKNEIPLNEYYSVLYYKKKSKTTKLRLERKFFPDPIEYVNTLGVRDWFADFGQSHKKVYCVSREDIQVPTFSMEVADVREFGEEMVYDIVEIKDHHNFLANGVCTHQCSLYPSIIIAYNLDYTTMVTDPSIPDEKCHVFNFWDHSFCLHDTTIRKTKTKGTVICKERNFRFLKEPPGVIPTLLKNLLDARKNTRKEIKTLEKKVKEDKTLTPEQIEDLERMIVVLDKRQLSYKINSNSMYGAMGVKKGYLPFFPGAMVTTYVGRISIEKASKWIQETHKVKLIYGDTYFLIFIFYIYL